MDPAQRNIATIVKMEEEFLRERSPAERVVDATVDKIGTIGSFLIHLVAFTAWIILNSGIVPNIQPWDPFPFILLTMFVSMEGVILALFVLMKQNRMSRRADERDHLHLQVNLLAEKEITTILQLQQHIITHLGMPAPPHEEEVDQLARETAVENLANEIREKLPDA